MSRGNLTKFPVSHLFEVKGGWVGVQRLFACLDNLDPKYQFQGFTDKEKTQFKVLFKSKSDRFEAIMHCEE